MTSLPGKAEKIYNFDEEVNRIGTNSHKYDNLEMLFGLSPKKTLSMWTADMDFKAPECVFDALDELSSHGIFGYYGGQKTYNAALEEWYQVQHNWSIDPSSISVVHGLCAGISIAIRAFSKQKDGIIVFTPVYHSFINIIKQNNRIVVEHPMYIHDNQYQIDFDRLERTMTGNEKIMLFCSPHNPGGKVWSLNDLARVGEFCEKHDLILISDEIHNDLVFSQKKHTMFPVAAPDIIDRLVVLVSSSKTFNIAGGLMGNVIIENLTLRRKFQQAHKAIGTMPNLFGMKIAESVYRNGHSWLDQLLIYLEKNVELFDEGISKIPGLRSMKLSATYLAWVDFSMTGLPEKSIIERVHHTAGIAASIGSSFGRGGHSFMRFNLACPRVNVLNAVKRLQSAF